MFMFLIGLIDTDYCDNYTDNCYYNTNDCFLHQIRYLSLYFPIVSPPKILEVLKMYSFWQKVNHLPFVERPTEHTYVPSDKEPCDVPSDREPCDVPSDKTVCEAYCRSVG